MTIEKLTSALSKIKPQEYHELLDGKVIPYLDADHMCTEPEIPQLEKQIIKEISVALYDIYDNPTILIAKRSGYSPSKDSWKASIRFYIRNVGYYMTVQHCKHDLIKQLEDKNVGSDYLDTGVYKQHGQTMGLI